MDEDNDSGMGLTWVTEESSGTDYRTQYNRLCELESDAESGWLEEDRHKFSLVRAPNPFLKAVEIQVR
jgi:hypothetical protein